MDTFHRQHIHIYFVANTTVRGPFKVTTASAEVNGTAMTDQNKMMNEGSGLDFQW